MATDHSGELKPRARQLLRTLIGRYIHDGEPVGSHTLARHAGLDISPATIRSILGDLEDLGLLASPHTSAGRVPTAQGYRVFVDSLLQVEPLGDPELCRLREELPSHAGTRQLLGNAGELLSAMSHFVGVVSAERRASVPFRRIEFVALSVDEVLAIVVFSDNEVQNRVVRTGKAYDPGELERVANYLNAHFAGLPIAQVKRQLLAELRAARDELHVLMSQALELAELAIDEHAVDDRGDSELVMAGHTKLMGVQELADIARLRDLFETFGRKRDMLQLLDRTLHAEGVRIFIGEETGLAPMGDDMALVAAPYGNAGRVLGVLGVIGPRRMAYDQVIPLVQATAGLLGEALGQDRGS
ncbi:heat-inducible transcriptional repressor HrcA [Solilutibacter silvestris]|uniref:Heat-inducible transcription repressor HrcA n=1 Tax=Solilutibacter silvestris TaxID=1645665 RepID=A0A2K1PZ57_9GAMM|nr:heat-inducible transcriptional repressor HrcA [Lysobacter silvestris]PNS08075.1 hrcA: heat-inducible transcription repressor HrcA [Lysobacter silvestris]